MTSYYRLFLSSLRVTIALLIMSATNQSLAATLNLQLRTRSAEAPSKTTEKPVMWDASKTAIIVCDMWDDHWCQSAARRVTEMAPALNRMLNAARDQGAFIIHAPSSVTTHYAGQPQRKAALSAPYAKAPIELSKAERWGTTWCWPDPTFEGVLPIDDTDMGCSCHPEKCEIRDAWSQQIDAIKIHPKDAITDQAQETYNLLAANDIENVILCGVHLNMCVLGRPFGIRQMVKLGKNVALVRDMTDTMYNPERPPGVDHFTGTDLVVAHVEKHWCPSFESDDIVGGTPFRFQEDQR
ncbi:protein-signal peptide and transmembrane prediction [Verrucomicrobia bacterium]|jgi:nicotinamidase-related amidase|nr:protein-signal peptide and transmembrane prediction [Verrucomicrobiota bacterium]MDB4798529.1 protein-signal peptide and transmembrane prediction [Verrucomicrobiota bacterium]